MSGEVKILDRAEVEGLRCWVEGSEAVIEFSLNHAAVLEAGFGRLLFRQGEGWQAGFKHLSVGFKKAAEVGRLSVSITLRKAVGFVKNFRGAICAPMVKIDVPGGRDVWLMAFTPAYDSSSIRVSKPALTNDRAFVQECLSAGEEGLRYSLSAYGSGFRRAGLESLNIRN